MPTYTVEQVILNGRDLHPLLDDNWTASKPLFRYLNRLQKRLMPLIADKKRDALQSTEQIAMPLPDHDAGHQMAEHILVHGAEVVFTNTNLRNAEARILYFRERLKESQYRFVLYIQDRRVFPLGEATDWNDVAQIDVKYFPFPAALVTLASSFTLPKDPLDCLTEHAAYFLAKRHPDIDPTPFLIEAERAEAEYLRQATGRGRAEVDYIMDVW